MNSGISNRFLTLAVITLSLIVATVAAVVADGATLSTSVTDTLADQQCMYAISNMMFYPEGTTQDPWYADQYVASRYYDSSEGWISYKAASGRKITGVTLTQAYYFNGASSAVVQTKRGSGYWTTQTANSRDTTMSGVWWWYRDIYQNLAVDEARVYIPASPTGSYWCPTPGTVNLTVGNTSAIVDVKNATNDKPVFVDDATVVASYVKAAGPISFVVEELNRTCGIRVISGQAVNPGDIVSINGVAATVSGERVIDASSGDVSVTSSGNPVPSPLGVTNRCSGGGSYGMQGAVVDVAPDTMSTGINNIGILARMWGRVTYVSNTGSDDDYFYVDDGYGLQDGSGYTGIKCRRASGASLPYNGDYVCISGVMGVQQINGANVRYFWTTSVSVTQTAVWDINIKALVYFGLYTNVLDIDGAVNGWNAHCDFTWVDCPPNGAENPPSSLSGYNVVVLSDVNFASLGSTGFEMLHTYVQQGGHLLVTGGLYALGNGEFGSSAFLQALPVTLSGPFDLKW
ncbi:MAG: hypothetical protein ACYC64_08575, partial [Armatimonadota bacterium]